MAKKKKKAGSKTSAQVPSTGAMEDGPLARAEAEYERGSYAGVRRILATADGASDAERTALTALYEKTTIDRAQLLVGLGAFLAAVAVGFLTLVQ